MSKRIAILIASPTANTDVAKSETYLRGSFYDIDNWSTFLQRPIGGCWNRNEIRDLSNYDCQKFFDEIELLKNADYVFLAYSGHGYTDGSNDYIFMNNGTESIKVEDIRQAVLKANPEIKGTLIFDSCRIGVTQEKSKPITVPSLSLNENFLDELVKNARSDWDDKLAACNSKGIVVIQTCDRFEAAFMRESGDVSVFSYHMANDGFEADLSLNVGEAFMLAQEQTATEVDSWKCPSKKQHPQCNSPVVDYPFSLGKESNGLNIAAALAVL